MLTATDAVWIDSGLDLTKQLQAAGVEVLTPAPFRPDSSKSAVLSEIKRSGFRIVLFMAFEDDTQEVASSSKGAGMARPGWAWVSVAERKPMPSMQVQRLCTVMCTNVCTDRHINMCVCMGRSNYLCICSRVVSIKPHSITLI